MAKQVEFYFDFGSPNAYLAYARLPELASRAGAEIVWKPMLLGGVFKATGNNSPITVPAKLDWMRRDTARYLRHHPVPFERNPHFPVNSLTMMRGAIAFQGQGEFDRYVKTCFAGMWVEPRNLNEPAELDALLGEAGFDVQQFRDRVNSQEIKDGLLKATEEAVGRDVFGAPTFIVGDELFFGKDRLEFVEEALGEI